MSKKSTLFMHNYNLVHVHVCELLDWADLFPEKGIFSVQSNLQSVKQATSVQCLHVNCV